MSGYTCPNGHASEAGDYCDVCGTPIPPGSGVVSGSGASSGASAGVRPEAGPDASAAGSPDAAGQGAVPSSTQAASVECPHCRTDNAPDALFCESCGYDFTTGTNPRSADPAASSLDLDAASAPTAGQTPPKSPAATQAPDADASAVAPNAPEWVAEVWVDPDWYAAQVVNEECPSPGLPVVVPLRTRSLLLGRRSASRNITPDIEVAGDTGVSRRQAQLTSDGQRWWVEDLQSSNGTYVAPASGPLPESPVPPGQRQELDEDDRVYVGAWTRLVVRRATPEEQAGQG